MSLPTTSFARPFALSIFTATVATFIVGTFFAQGTAAMSNFQPIEPTSQLVSFSADAGFGHHTKFQFSAGPLFPDSSLALYEAAAVPQPALGPATDLFEGFHITQAAFSIAGDTAIATPASAKLGF